MNFIETKMNYADFTMLLKDKTGASLIGDFDCDKPHIEKIANECLSAKNGNYPTLYYFSEVNGAHYILFTYNGRQHIIEADGNLDSKVDCQPTVCKQFVLQDSCFWNIDGNPYYPAVMGIYSMTDCVDELKADEKNVVVWCERNWREDYMNVPLNEYYCGDNKKPIVFETVADAKALIDSLIKEPYTLQPHEASRPTYIVTY